MCIQQASPVSLTVPVAKTLAKVTPRFLCWGLATHLQCQQSSALQADMLALAFPGHVTSDCPKDSAVAQALFFRARCTAS